MHKSAEFSNFESGIVSGEDSEAGSSLKVYFDNFVPRLRHAVSNMGDPTIDLNLVEEGSRAIATAAPVTSQKHTETKNMQKSRRTSTNATFRVEKENSLLKKTRPSGAVGVNQQRPSLTQQADVSVHELKHLVDTFKTNNPYSNKLKTIMLKGLEETLGKDYFEVFINVGFPKHTFPIVKMNSDNTPYVEVLIKSEKSDEDPHRQLNEYTPTHLVYSDLIVEQLRRSENVSISSAKHEQSTVPMCSTPKHNKIPPAMDRSKRTQPVRACKYK